VKELESKMQEKIDALQEREGALTFENQALQKQIEESQRVYGELETNL